MLITPNGSTPAQKSRIAPTAQLGDTQKVIFLDVDGVLNVVDDKYRLPWTFHGRHLRGINPVKVAVLNRILKATGAKIVLSSSWRKPENDREKEYLTKQAGIHEWDQRYVGDTPVNVTLSGSRALEIRAWIERNKFKGRFAVLDDMAIGLNDLMSNLFLTNEYYGLTDKIADKVIAHLNR